LTAVFHVGLVIITVLCRKYRRQSHSKKCAKHLHSVKESITLQKPFAYNRFVQLLTSLLSSCSTSPAVLSSVWLWFWMKVWQAPSLPTRDSVFHSNLKTHLFRNSFPPESFLFIQDCLHGTCTELSGHWRLFVLVSSFSYFSGYVCYIKLIIQLLSPRYSCFVSCRHPFAMKSGQFARTVLHETFYRAKSLE